MSDHRRQSRAIRQAWAPGEPVEPQGHRARPWVTRAARLSGLVARQSPQRPTGASHVPAGTTLERRGTRLARWGGPAPLVAEGSCVP
jgi:hypothetical protein